MNLVGKARRISEAVDRSAWDNYAVAIKKRRRGRSHHHSV